MMAPISWHTQFVDGDPLHTKVSNRYLRLMVSGISIWRNQGG